MFANLEKTYISTDIVGWLAIILSPGTRIIIANFLI